MQIMPDIFLKGTLSPQNSNSAMVPFLNGAPRKNLRHIEAVPMQKQDKCAQEY